MFIRNMDHVPSTIAGAKAFLAMYGGEEICFGINSHLMVVTPCGTDFEVELDGAYQGVIKTDEVAKAIVSLKKASQAKARYNTYRNVCQPENKFQGYRLPLDPEPRRLGEQYNDFPVADAISSGLRFLSTLTGGARRNMY